LQNRIAAESDPQNLTIRQKLGRLIRPTGKSRRRYAQIARRANLSQPDGIAVTPKSAADFAPSRPHQEGRFAIVTNVEAGCGGRGGVVDE
jgi:hypothetical protein